MRRLGRTSPALLALIAVALLSLIAYANSLSNTFQFDDYEGIVDNSALHDLRNIPSYFTHPTLFRFNKADWRPVLQITYALDYSFAGAEPTMFHATNIVFHAAAAWLIFLIASEIERRRPLPESAAAPIPAAWLALVAAALFAVHTVNTQTVNYIWARSSLLAAFFYLLSFYCYLCGPLNAEGKGGRAWHLGGLFVFIAGMATKATMASLPAMLAAYEVLFLNPGGRNPFLFYLKEPRRLLKYLPLAGILIAYLAIRSDLLPNTVKNLVAPPWIGRRTYLLTQFRAWIYYLKLYVWPDPLILDYPGFGWSSSLGDLRVLASLALIAAIMIVAWRARRSAPILTFFALWFFIALAPEASIVVRPDKVTGHRPYLAYAGVSVAAAVLSLLAAGWLWRRWKRERPRGGSFRVGYAMAIGIVLVALTGATIKRNLDWRDPITLWTDVLRKDPTNPRAYTTLALEYSDSENYDKAQQLLDHAVQISPTNSSVYFYRGYLNSLLERNDAALADFTKSIDLRRGARPLVYRGDVYRKLARYDEALKDYQHALELNPRIWEAYFGLAMVHWERNELEPASAACGKLNRMNPRYRQGYTCLGSLLMHQGRFDEALKVYHSGVARFPEDATVWYGLGTAYEELGLYGEAQNAYAKSSALMRRPPIEKKSQRTAREN
jgi:tetratricopeptide (TPR) repeat protein